MRKYNCFDEDGKLLFEYAFGIEPQAGDRIALTDSELEGEEIITRVWTVSHRVFVEGDVTLILYPTPRSGIVPC